MSVPQEIPCHRQLASDKAAEGEAVARGGRAVKVTCGAMHSCVLTGGDGRGENGGFLEKISGEVENMEIENIDAIFLFGILIQSSVFEYVHLKIDI